MYLYNKAEHLYKINQQALAPARLISWLENINTVFPRQLTN